MRPSKIFFNSADRKLGKAADLWTKFLSKKLYWKSLLLSLKHKTFKSFEINLIYNKK